LPVPGGPIEKHAIRRIDAEALEELGMAERKLHHLANLLDGVAESANVVIGDIGAPRFLRLLILRAQLDLGLRRDLDDASRDCREHDEADLL